MKAGIKKLRTCAFTKAVAPSGFMRQSAQLTHKLICDHPEMKKEWTEKKCESCTAYLNRNFSPEPPSPPAPAIETPNPVSSASEPEAAPPKKTRVRKPRTSDPA
jgi:hypothetical protein